MEVQRFHRHLGVYGICVENIQLLTVKKTRGPYRNRYDLPGGTIEPNESIVQAIHREFEEETGSSIRIKRNIGTAEFVVRYPIQEATHIQHIAIFVEVEIEGEQNQKNNHLSDDTTGIEWLEIQRIDHENASPLVTIAKEYIMNNKIECLSLTYDHWDVKETKVYG